MHRWEDDDVIDMRDIVACVWRKRWWVVGSFVAFSAAFIAAAYTMEPVYRASVVFIPASSDGAGLGGNLGSALAELGGLASIVGINARLGESDTDEAVAVLRSRQFVGKFIHDNNLMPVLYQKLWDPTKENWQPGVKPPTPAKAYQYFSRISTLIPDRETGLMTLQIDWRNGTEAAMWANTLVGRLNSEMRSRAIEQTDAMLDYLEAELQTTSVVEMRNAINSLIEAQIKQRMLANVTREYAFRVVDPATVPDLDAPVRPRKRVLAAIGGAVGFGVGLLIAVTISFLAGDLRPRAADVSPSRESSSS